MPYMRERFIGRFTVSDLVGLIAACLTTLSFVPQAILVIRTRVTEGISLAMYALFTLGVSTWLAYGLMIGAWPIIIANIVTVCLAGIILTIKLLAVLRPQPSTHGAAVSMSAPIDS